MLQARIRYKETNAEILYDPQNGFDVLGYQIASLFEDIEDPILIDFAGRQIKCDNDINDIAQASDFGSNSDLSIEADNITAVVNIWVLDESVLHVDKVCTSNIFGSEKIIQPYHRIIDTTLQLCGRCIDMISSDLIVNHTDHLGYFCCDRNQVLEIGLGNEILPVRIETWCQNLVAAPAVKYYLLRKFMNDAISTQKLLDYGESNVNAIKTMESRLSGGVKTVMVFEDAYQQSVARKCIDYACIHKYVLEFLSENEDKAVLNIKLHEEVAFVKALLRWFKNDFFKWCNKPPCSNPSCTSKDIGQNMVALG